MVDLNIGSVLYLVLAILCMCAAVTLIFTDHKVLPWISIALALTLLIIDVYAGNHIEDKPWTYSEITYVEHITALQDNSKIYGRRTHINEEMYYIYLVELADGGTIMNKVPADRATVYETDSNFRVEWYNRKRYYLGLRQTEQCWKIYIPKGSMITDFNIDLKE